MSTKSVCQSATFALLAACAMGAWADDKSDYDRRSAARYMNLFQSLDRNADGAVTRLETQSDLNFSPRFDDMDINRDGVVTSAELQRYVDREHPTHESGEQR